MMYVFGPSTVQTCPELISVLKTRLLPTRAPGATDHRSSVMSKSKFANW